MRINFHESAPKTHLAPSLSPSHTKMSCANATKGAETVPPFHYSLPSNATDWKCFSENISCLTFTRSSPSNPPSRGISTHLLCDLTSVQGVIDINWLCFSEPNSILLIFISDSATIYLQILWNFGVSDYRLCHEEDNDSYSSTPNDQTMDI